jgi:hypothetical protein
MLSVFVEFIVQKPFLLRKGKGYSLPTADKPDIVMMIHDIFVPSAHSLV